MPTERAQKIIAQLKQSTSEFDQQRLIHLLSLSPAEILSEGMTLDLSGANLSIDAMQRLANALLQIPLGSGTFSCINLRDNTINDEIIRTLARVFVYANIQVEVNYDSTSGTVSEPMSKLNQAIIMELLNLRDDEFIQSHPAQLREFLRKECTFKLPKECSLQASIRLFEASQQIYREKIIEVLTDKHFDQERLIRLLQNIVDREVLKTDLSQASLSEEASKRLSIAQNEIARRKIVNLLKNLYWNGPYSSSRQEVQKELTQFLEGVTSLNLADEHLTSKAITILASALQENRTLTKLTLWGNQVDAEGASLLYQMQIYNPACKLRIEQTQEIMHIIVWLNEPNETNAQQQLSVLLANCASLDLSNAGLNAQAIRRLITVLRENVTIKTLILRGNDINDDDMLQLIQVLGDHPNIITLDLSNTHLSSKAVTALTQLVQKQKTLHDLYLCDNGIDQKQIQDMTQAFTGYSTLLTQSKSGSLFWHAPNRGAFPLAASGVPQPQ